MTRLLLCWLLLGCAQPQADSAPLSGPRMASAHWPVGFGRFRAGTDTVTVCAWVTSPDGTLRRGRTAIVARRERADSISFVMLPDTGRQLAPRCAGPGDVVSYPVRWKLHRGRIDPTGPLSWIPHPTLIEPAGQRG